MALWCCVVLALGATSCSTASRSGHTISLTTAATSTVTSTTNLLAIANGQCSDNRLPFRPGYLPDNWTTSSYGVWAGVDPVSGIAGIVEVVHGGDLPVPAGKTEAIKVLGRKATLGSISDGYTVWFSMADTGEPCDQWALIAHPHTSRETLQRIAEQLT